MRELQEYTVKVEMLRSGKVSAFADKLTREPHIKSKTRLVKSERALCAAPLCHATMFIIVNEVLVLLVADAVARSLSLHILAGHHERYKELAVLFSIAQREAKGSSSSSCRVSIVFGVGKHFFFFEIEKMFFFLLAVLTPELWRSGWTVHNLRTFVPCYFLSIVLLISLGTLLAYACTFFFLPLTSLKNNNQPPTEPNNRTWTRTTSSASF